MRCIFKSFHTCSWCFIYVISNFTWLICIKIVKLKSKRLEFNWKFNSNVLTSIQGVSRVSREIPEIHFPFNQTCYCDSNENMLFQLILFQLTGFVNKSFWIFSSYSDCSAILSYWAPCADMANIDALMANQIADILVAIW